MKKTALNLPNTLSLIRVLLVPVFVVTLFLMRDIEFWGLVVPTLVYIITGATDFVDGKIARKYNLITDFGKFIDPLADKFMVIGSQIALLPHMLLTYTDTTVSLVFCAVVLLILFRELAVTSLRLVVAGKSGIVVAASMLGKWKTFSQMVGTVLIILEPIFIGWLPWLGNHLVAYVSMAVMAFTTIFSGIDYLKAYLPHINSSK